MRNPVQYRSLWELFSFKSVLQTILLKSDDLAKVLGQKSELTQHLTAEFNV